MDCLNNHHVWVVANSPFVVSVVVNSLVVPQVPSQPQLWTSTAIFLASITSFGALFDNK